jgi:hypothetical protein
MKVNGFLFYKNLREHDIVEKWFDSNGVKDFQCAAAKNALLESIYKDFQEIT